MKLSIIVPVYRVENTLDRCIESIIRQSFRDIQLILVDDASPDRCPDICDNWVQKDHRIQVIHLAENGGLSKARNEGMKKARGEYLMFVDSDDRLEPDTLEQLMSLLTVHPDFDMLEFPVIEHYGNPLRQQLLSFGQNKTYTDWRKYWLEEKTYLHSYAWNKVYRRELLRGIWFPEGVVFEDLWFLPQVIKRCRLMANTSVGLYYYYDNLGGITHTAGAKELKNQLDAHLHLLSEIHDAGYYEATINTAIDYYEHSGQIIDLPRLPYQSSLKLKINRWLGFKTLCIMSKLVHQYLGKKPSPSTK